MNQILVIETSPLRLEASSNRLSKVIVDRILKKRPDMEVKVRDLVANPPPFLTHLEFGAYSDEAIAELMNSEIVVINVATHNYSIPAVLKAWIDQIVRAGKTFSYSATGPEGLLKGKKLYLSIASGGVYSGPQPTGPDFTESYLKAILGFVGMTDLTSFRVEGLAIPGIKETAFEKAVEFVTID
jgi:FMN-dependent NADH-azoreductase